MKKFNYTRLSNIYSNEEGLFKFFPRNSINWLYDGVLVEFNKNANDGKIRWEVIDEFTIPRDIPASRVFHLQDDEYRNLIESSENMRTMYVVDELQFDELEFSLEFPNEEQCDAHQFQWMGTLINWI